MDKGIEHLRQDFMRQAIEIAREGILQGQTPFGACIVKGDKVVACEHNRVWQELDSTLHAEICVIRMAERRLGTIDLSGCTIFSTTEPCPMCFSAIHWAKITQIIYSSSIPDARRHGFSELSISNLQMREMGQSPVRIRGGFLKEEGQSLFEEWSRRKDKRSY